MKRWFLQFRVLGLVTGLILCTGGLSGGLRAQTSEKVDLVIVLALDVSASVDAREYDLMRAGLASALISPEVEKAIFSGTHKSVVVSVMQWSGFQEQVVKIGWRRISSSLQLHALAEDIRLMNRRYEGGATDIGGAIAFCRELIENAPYDGARSVIDIAGDGSNNVNASPDLERDKTVAEGITINGLAVTGEGGAMAEYYARFVIGGNGAFVEQAPDFDGFERAMTRKLTQEMDVQLLY